MPSGLRPRLLGLCIAPLLFCLLDVTLTLVGQTAEYWRGGYHAHVIEGSPTPHFLLSIHPLAFVAGMLVWIMSFLGLLLLLPETLALILSIAIVMGHAVGAATWIFYRFRFGYQICDGLFLLAAVAIGSSIRFGWQARPKESLQFDRMPQLLRWAIVALLFGLAVWLILWPTATPS